MLGVIGGSSLTNLQSLTKSRILDAETPYGRPSGPMIMGGIGKAEVVFIARHGPHHSIPPHLINYRANIWALKESGVTSILAVAAVGGIKQELVPGSIVVPDQIIDCTWGRESTYWALGSPPLHIDFTMPYSRDFRQGLLNSAAKLSIPIVDHGVYAVTQGPRLESAAEIRKLSGDGATVVGMTGMPEAALARELGLEYATIAVVVNHAAGVGECDLAISLLGMERVSRESSKKIEELIQGVCAQ